jgi:membrane-bound metal-dependent hydrolase YbcI (DUF457 family)
VFGRDHALLGAVAGVGLAEPVARLAHTHLPPGQVAAVGVICAGFALLPDIDEPGSTVSRKLGPVSEAVAAVTNKLAGGHRQATHSLWFAGGMAALVWWLGRFALAAPILVYGSLALTLTMVVPGHLVRKGSALALIGPMLAGWAVWRAETGFWLTDPTRVADPRTWAWLPVAAGAGVLLHLAGDMLTVEGVPLLWPARLRLAAPLLGHTDTSREQLVGACLSVALVALAWVQVLHPLLNAKGSHL